MVESATNSLLRSHQKQIVQKDEYTINSNLETPGFHGEITYEVEAILTLKHGNEEDTASWKVNIDKVMAFEEDGKTRYGRVTDVRVVEGELSWKDYGIEIETKSNINSGLGY